MWPHSHIWSWDLSLVALVFFFQHQLWISAAARQSQTSGLRQRPAASPLTCSSCCANSLLYPISSDTHVYVPSCSGPMLSTRKRHHCSLQLHDVLLPWWCQVYWAWWDDTGQRRKYFAFRGRVTRLSSSACVEVKCPDAEERNQSMIDLPLPACKRKS